MITILKNNIRIETKSSCLILEIKSFDDNSTPYILGRYYLTNFYYGPKKDDYGFTPSNQKLNWSGACNDYNYDLAMNSTFGDANNVEGSILIRNVDKTYINRFFYVGAEVINGEVDNNLPHSRNVLQTLVIKEEDKEANLTLYTYYSIFEDSDVIAVKRKIVNNNKEAIKIKNIASLQLPIATKEVTIYTYDGAWLLERYRHETTISSGTFINESILTSSSHKHNPFIQIKDNTNNGTVYSFNLIWSGNHKEFVDLDWVKEQAVVTVGINSYLFSYSLAGGEEFITPEAVMCVKDTLENSSKEMREFVNNHIINPKWLKERPVLFNSWEGSEFNINEENISAMAKKCHEVGMDLFVIDDGWFKGRVDDFRALGDWEPDANKFPNGFKHCADIIKAEGLQFGFWIEPEMISILSDTYKNHPEFACEIPGREPIERRHQLMIDMANPKVVDYVFNMLCKVIDETEPAYIKWDFNRNMSEAFSHDPSFRAGEHAYKYVLGSYDLMRRLTTKYPNLMFEGCSSGGGRYDLGIFYFMPQTWGSDNSNSYIRSFISCGTFAGYPVSTFGAHISLDHFRFTGEDKASSLEDRFNLQALGGFGYEFDVTKLDQKDLDVIKDQISFYKQYRNLFQFGDLEIVDNIFDNNDYYSYQVGSKDGKEFIFTVIQTRPEALGRAWKMKNLDENSTYVVETRKQFNLDHEVLKKKEFTGKELMNEGIVLDSMYDITDKNVWLGIFSRMFIVRRK